jgi:hypothetical protein
MRELYPAPTLVTKTIPDYPAHLLAGSEENHAHLQLYSGLQAKGWIWMELVKHKRWFLTWL